MTDEFNFYLRGFKTLYTARPTGDTMTVYAGNEAVTHFERTELTNMLKNETIVRAYEENN